ncbi:hypothetical protein [Marispirochaeta sp.]|uniref:hypothetical protein n=1 Tax=Marispirochaeta sp. TaxID=2038653 RepID=UPI0029C7DDF8|nr:hypothetical protein [Marispirochaeta sp.]
MGPAGLGFQEILLIGVLLLVFVRPEEIPAIFRRLGRIWAKAYYYYTLAKREMRNMEKEIGIEEEMKEIRAINARIRSEIANFDKAVKKETGDNPTAPVQNTEENSKEN